ncbi:hypothetical protein I3760_08G008400 [Carya illinoinensis]|nr:hypothetical protein I3760_08G008400 [Carya illinoinensis]
MDSQPEQSPSLEDCLKLLEGERDEQRLAGLFLVTKFCKGDDNASLRRVYNAVGFHFLDRLLRTGMGKGSVGGSGADNRDAYLKLSITVLAALCRVPEIASSKDMNLKIPLILEIMSKDSGSSVLEECYEFLYLVSTASEDGALTLYESGVMKVLASQISTFSDDSHLMEIATKLVMLILSKLSLDVIAKDYLSELSVIVSTMARPFAVLQNSLKFELLHLLCTIISLNYLAPLHDALRVMPNGSWSYYMRDGIAAILHSRVAPAERLEALMLAETMVNILGGQWLLGQVNLPHKEDLVPVDRLLLLVLEQSRVEVAVLLNELAYLKFEASKSCSSIAEKILLKQRNVAIAFSLMEKIIKLISDTGGNEGDSIDESTLTNVIRALNETISVVLEYLQDAKEHGQRKGDDLLASVRIVGSYLAEAPFACKEKIEELLEYMLLIEGEDEQSPFYSICFLLPMLCQITMKIEGCNALASSGGHKAVMECLIKLIGPDNHMVENDSSVFLACDTIMNLLLKKEHVLLSLDESTYVHLLKALAYWTEDTEDLSVIMMASSICALIFDFTSEKALLNHPNFDGGSLNGLSRLIARSLASGGQDMSEDANAEADLLEIVNAGYTRWAPRFPHIRAAVEINSILLPTEEIRRG